MLQTDEQVAKRAAQLERLAALPEHLQLGVTLPGMRELLSKLPSDAVEQVNGKISIDWQTGKPIFPENVGLNSFVNEYFITLEAHGDRPGVPLTACERLQKQGSPHVGEAHFFLILYHDTPFDTVFDVLSHFLEQQGLWEEDTFFWVALYVTRQTDGTDLKSLGECVRAVGHTLLLPEPWDAPASLKVVNQLYHTQASDVQFDVVMSTAQQAAFEAALVNDFDSIQKSLSKVDARTASRLDHKPDDSPAILGELEQGVGFVECNKLGIALLREALVAKARAALARLPAAERGTSVLLSNLGLLLQAIMGQLEEARPLLEESLQACRETLGDHHPSTSASINNMGQLLKDMGQLKEAMPLLEEALKARRETLGDRHSDTLASVNNMGRLLLDIGQLKKAMPQLEEALQARRVTLGDRHSDTLASINNMGMLLKARGLLAEARPLLEDVGGFMASGVENQLGLDRVSRCPHVRRWISGSGG